MRRSFLRLIAASVLFSWAAGFLVLFVYLQSQSWSAEKARREGVFLAHELLEQEQASNRERRLRELRQHFSFELSLVSVEDVERRVGRTVRAGEQVPHRVSGREEWYFLLFDDGQGALAAGPVDPAIPPGVFPVGWVLVLVGVPLLAALLALRVERSLRKVEQASEALAVGDLSARVESPDGPSTELALRFNAMAERVERLVRSRDELVQAVSHELGSPLSRLRFHLEFLVSRSDSDAHRDERIHAMASELDALDALVAELLNYVQSADLALDQRTFDPSRVVADLAELARLEAPEGRMPEVAVDFQSGDSVFADARLFQRAVENLLRNAVRHARQRVLVELKAERDRVRVTVHDDGPGIPEEQRDKVVIPFFRLDADRGRKTGGAGLGLAIVNRIMQRHGGRLGISDSPLGGAAVGTWWPRSG